MKNALRAQSAALARAGSAKQAADRSRVIAEEECQLLRQTLMYTWNKDKAASSNAERSADSVAEAAADAAIAAAASAAPALPAP